LALIMAFIFFFFIREVRELVKFTCQVTEIRYPGRGYDVAMQLFFSNLVALALDKPGDYGLVTGSCFNSKRFMSLMRSERNLFNSCILHYLDFPEYAGVNDSVCHVLSKLSCLLRCAAVSSDLPTSMQSFGEFCEKQTPQLDKFLFKLMVTVFIELQSTLVVTHSILTRAPRFIWKQDQEPTVQADEKETGRPTERMELDSLYGIKEFIQANQEGLKDALRNSPHHNEVSRTEKKDEVCFHAHSLISFSEAYYAELQYAFQVVKFAERVVRDRLLGAIASASSQRLNRTHDSLKASSTSVASR
jgi:hypothetical protein